MIVPRGRRSVKVVNTPIPDVKILVPDRHTDPRGFFSETWNQRTFAESGLGPLNFVQDNHCFSVSKSTVRGLHFQLAPGAQYKLVRVASGAILDVAVDLRRSSATFGRHVAVQISAEAWNQVLVPVGFAHGYCTLAPNTQVMYKVTSHYDPDLDRGLMWNDPELGIDWPVSADEAEVSERDRGLPPLSDLADLFD